ncbi:hypothetical protein [Cryptosporangium japonicum]|uniref:Uncharacterized protein n=1 Tax=Cryptosporangium japonicum TaxID=80872 RepID=A0ABP3DU32_9ACTN
MAEPQVAFKAADYDALIKFYDNTSDAVVKDLMHDQTNSPRLDDSIVFKPGSSSWDLAQSATTKLKALATGFNAQYKTLESRYGDFAVQLTGARDVFDDTDNLANYSAQDFVTNYLGEANVIGRPEKKK